MTRCSLFGFALSILLPATVFAQAGSFYVLERLGPWPASAMPGGVSDTMPQRLLGNHKFIRWSNIGNSNNSKFAHSASTLLPRPAGYPVPLPRVTAANGTITRAGLYELEPIAPGYRATEGFYFMGSDFGLRALIAPTAMIGPSYGIKSLIFQTATMLNWPAGWTLEDYFNYDHASHFDAHSRDTGDMSDYNANPNLLALSTIQLDDGTLYQGGPVLKYTLTNGTVGYRHATNSAMFNNGIRMDELGATGEWSGTYFAFAWQWDLRDITGIIATAEVISPLIVHSSTIGAQIDVSDTYNDVLSTYAPPPPSQLIATPGDSAILLTWQARTNAEGYRIKRSITSGGPYVLVGTVSDGSASFNDSGLTNGTTYHYVVSAYNTLGGEGDASIQRSATPAIPSIAAWRQTHFGSEANTGPGADSADPDRDGLPNLLEYALDRQPLVPDSAGAIALAQTTTGTKRLTLTFDRRADAGLVYIVEATDDLASGQWERVFLSTGLANPNNNGYALGTSGVNSVVGNADDTYEVWDNVIISARYRRFLRLVVSTATSTVKSEPRGFQQVDLPVGTSSLGFPLLNQAVHTATVQGVTGSTLTLAGPSGLNLGALLASSSAYPFYLEVTSGPLEGERVDLNVAASIAANTNKIVLAAGSAQNTLAAARFGELNGQAVALRRHLTLAQIKDLFAPGLTGNAVPARADSVQVYGAAGFRQYTLGANHATWTTSGIAGDQRYLPIPPGTGILIKVAQAKTLVQTGGVRAHAFRHSLPAGSHFAAAPWPVPQSPSQFGAFVNLSQDAALRWTGNAIAARADTIQIHTPAGFVQYTLAANGTSWVKPGDANNFANSPLLQSDRAYLIKRQKAHPSYLLPRPY